VVMGCGLLDSIYLYKFDRPFILNPKIPISHLELSGWLAIRGIEKEKHIYCITRTRPNC